MNMQGIMMAEHLFVLEGFQWSNFVRAVIFKKVTYILEIFNLSWENT